MTNEHDAIPEVSKPDAASDAPKGIGPEPKHGPKHDKNGHDKHKRHAARRMALASAGVALLAVGAGVGAAAHSFARPSAQMAPLVPVAIAAMPADSIVTIKGKVAEIYGNKFVLQDDSGRALIETGRSGEGGKLVKASEPVTVQGRFDDGFLRAAFIVRDNGKTEAIGGPGFGPGPGHGPKHGPRHGDDRRGGPDGSRAEGPGADGPESPAGPGAPAAPAGPRTPL